MRWRLGRRTARQRAAEEHNATTALLALPGDLLAHVLYCLPLAHDIAASSLTCHALDNAVKNALKLRPFSSEVVPIPGVMTGVERALALPDGRFIIGTSDGEIKMCNGSFIQSMLTLSC